MKASELAERLQAYIILKGHYSALCHHGASSTFVANNGSGLIKYLLRSLRHGSDAHHCNAE